MGERAPHPGERLYRSHGDGRIDRIRFATIGENVIFEDGALVFHAERIRLGSNIYVGHYAILKAYHRNEMVVSDGAWIGQQCMFHSAGGITIGRNVGIGPGVRILTSQHERALVGGPLIHAPLDLGPVTVEDDANIGWPSSCRTSGSAEERSSPQAPS